MLVLNRKNGEEIKIGNNISVKVICVSEGGVKIGIDAPEDIPILRGELYVNIKENLMEATAQSKLNIGDTHSLEINKLRETNDD